MNFIDFHCDTLARLFGTEMPEASSPQSGTHDTLWESSGHLDLPRLINAGYTAQFFACFLNLKNPPRESSHFDDALSMADLLRQSLSGSSRAALSLSGSDYARNKKEDRLSCFLTMEEGGILAEDLTRIQTLHDVGVRLITLTWNYPNCIGFPHKYSGSPDSGLTPFGKETVQEMERLKMLVDVSHLSDEGFWDVARLSRRPFVASHSCCRSLCPHSRNLTDEMIRQIGERQGLVAVNYYGPFLRTDGVSTAEDIVRHIRHVIQKGGLECAALGSDFDGMDGILEISGCQDVPLLLPAMEKAGFTSSEIEAVCYKNAERMLAL